MQRVARKIEKGISIMSLKAAKRFLVGGGILTLIGVLLLVNRSVELSPWVWAAFLAGAGLGALGLYLADRSDGLMLLSAYVLCAIAGLIALVPSGLLRDEAIACYVLPSIALPFLVAFALDRSRWWALIPAYPLLAVVGVSGLAGSGLLSDDLIAAYVLLAIALPFFLICLRGRKHWWALIPGGILAIPGLSFGTWLPWNSVRTFLTVVLSSSLRDVLHGAAGCLGL
jgi:hypothetical protein